MKSYLRFLRGLFTFFWTSIPGISCSVPSDLKYFCPWQTVALRTTHCENQMISFLLRCAAELAPFFCVCGERQDYLQKCFGGQSFPNEQHGDFTCICENQLAVRWIDFKKSTLILKTLSTVQYKIWFLTRTYICVQESARRDPVTKFQTENWTDVWKEAANDWPTVGLENSHSKMRSGQ